MSISTLSENLRRLLFEKNIKPTELARLTNVPQPTIQRIVAGTSTQPHSASLKPIADFFGITIEQLKGNTAIAWLKEARNDEIIKVPLLQWKDTVEWLENADAVSKFNLNNMIFTDAPVGAKSFALIIKDSAMEPVFRVGTTVIFDPEKHYKDRSFIIVKLASSDEVVFRQLLLDVEDKFIKPLNPDLEKFRMQLLKSVDKICATLVQAKYDFSE